MAPSEQLEYQAKTIHDLMANTSPEQLDNPTTCTNWQVRDLFNHLVGGGRMFSAAFKGEEGAIDLDAPMPDMLGDDPAAAWDGTVAAFREAVDAPGAIEREVTLPFGVMPGSVVLEIVKFDLLVHAWDIAQSTGQAFDPPDEVVEPAIAAAQMIIAPEARDGDTFAAEVAAPAGATPIQRLAAFSGRTV